MNKFMVNSLFFSLLMSSAVIYGSNNSSSKLVEYQVDNSSIRRTFGPARDIEEAIIMNIKELECSVRQLEKTVNGMANNICHLYQLSDVLDNKLLAQDERITLVEVDIDDTKEDMSVQAETIKGVVCDIDLIKDEVFDLRAENNNTNTKSFLDEVGIDDTKEDMGVQVETINAVYCDIDLIKDEIFDLRAKIESRFSLKKATKRSFRLKKATKKLRFILAQSGKSRVLPK